MTERQLPREYVGSVETEDHLYPIERLGNGLVLRRKDTDAPFQVIGGFDPDAHFLMARAGEPVSFDGTPTPTVDHLAALLGDSIQSGERVVGYEVDAEGRPYQGRQPHYLVTSRVKQVSLKVR